MILLRQLLLTICIFLPVVSVNASMGYPDVVRQNMIQIRSYARYQSVTNSPVNTWTPVCEVMKQNCSKKLSARQDTLGRLFSSMSVSCVFFLFVLVLTHSYMRVSTGMAWFLWLLLFAYSVLTYLDWDWWVPSILLLSAGLIISRNIVAIGRWFAGVITLLLLVSLSAALLLDKKGFSYLDDYSYPEYLTLSSSTNIVVIHEKIDLRYRERRHRRRVVLFKDGRMPYITTESLVEILQAQANEIAAYLRVSTNLTNATRQQGPNGDVRSEN